MLVFLNRIFDPFSSPSDTFKSLFSPFSHSIPLHLMQTNLYSKSFRTPSPIRILAFQTFPVVHSSSKPFKGFQLPKNSGVPAITIRSPKQVSYLIEKFSSYVTPSFRFFSI